MCKTLFFAAILACSAAAAQPRTDTLLAQLLLAHTPQPMQQVLTHATDYRCQVIYTQINRDAKNKPSFTHYFFNYDSLLYFNPASMVKMPLAFLALEKLNHLQVKGVNKYTTIQIDSSQPWQRPMYRDSTAANGMPSIAHYIKKVFLISDNDAYNRLFQFIGQQQIHRSLTAKGYPHAIFSRQFLGLTVDQNRHTNALRFVSPSGKTLYTQQAQYNTDSFDFSRKIDVGRGHINKNDSLVMQPFDFSWHNNISLLDFQQMQQSVLFPESFPPARRFQLTRQDQSFLKYWMSAFPSETDDPKYDTATFFDNYVKFFFYDGSHRMPAGIRVFNKVGWAYGFMTDVSYVIDTIHNIEYMLAATVYVNSDGIINDDKYEVDEVGHPFFYQLGQTIYQYELNRPRTFSPNLKDFKIKYEKRSPLDKRKAVAIADN